MLNASDELLNRAMRWAEEHHQQASINHKCAFANSVFYLCSGWCGGFGGPSLRQHIVTYKVLNHQPRCVPGEWLFENACLFAEPFCFNPPDNYASELLAISKQEYIFDDDPEDIVFLKAIMGNVKKNESGWYLEPPQQLTKPLINFVINQAKKQEGSDKKLCKGLVTPWCVCGKKLATQAIGDYCKKHQYQNPLHKEMVKRSRLKLKLKDK